MIALNGSSSVAQSIITTPLSSGSNSSFCIQTDFSYTDLRIAGKFGREKVWQIWQIVCDSPN